MNTTRDTTVAIVGGGPAGMILGLILARAGVEVTVLEKHEDFLRDFRGDTIHPSTLEVLDELGLSERFHRLRHRKITGANLPLGDGLVAVSPFATIRTKFPYIALVPQWDFLDLLAGEAETYPGFRLIMKAEGVDVIRSGGRIRGVRYRDEDGRHELRALLTVAADGRHSDIRRAAGLRAREFGSPIDVLWFRLTRRDGDPENILFQIAPGRAIVGLDRGDYWQCGYLMPKGGWAALRVEGLQGLRDGVAGAAPVFADRVDELRSFDDMGFLEVRVDRLRRWHLPGLLCIGDAAHAMSPVGGVGINLAVQDAVAAANILAGPLRRGRVDERVLAAVQRRRYRPTALTQLVQRVLQDQVLKRILSGEVAQVPPAARFVIERTPIWRYFAGRFIGLGFRPEHVRVPLAARAKSRTR